jgi:hypothetical protein
MASDKSKSAGLGGMLSTAASLSSILPGGNAAAVESMAHRDDVTFV